MCYFNAVTFLLYYNLIQPQSKTLHRLFTKLSYWMSYVRIYCNLIGVDKGGRETYSVVASVGFTLTFYVQYGI